MQTIELNRIYCEDNMATMARMPDNSVDAIVTDPPYGLGKEPDAAEMIAAWLDHGYLEVKGKGFMGKEWDAFVPQPKFWKEALRVLKPGGHVLSFFGSRTYDWGVLAMRLAGFEIRDCIMWVYGSGFPKSKASLKPAYEPIVVARKPFKGSAKKNIEKFGTGGFNVDGCRVGTYGARFNGRNVDSDIYGKYGTSKPKENYNKGRWPANFTHDGSPEVLGLMPDTSSGFMSAGTRRKNSENPDRNVYQNMAADYSKEDTHADSGSAARFFYCAKASKKDRNYGLSNGMKNTHPTVKPLKLMKWLVRLITPESGVVYDPYAGSGTTLLACKEQGFSFIGSEMVIDSFKIASDRLM